MAIHSNPDARSDAFERFLDARAPAPNLLDSSDDLILTDSGDDLLDSDDDLFASGPCMRIAPKAQVSNRDALLAQVAREGTPTLGVLALRAPAPYASHQVALRVAPRVPTPRKAIPQPVAPPTPIIVSQTPKLRLWRINIILLWIVPVIPLLRAWAWMSNGILRLIGDETKTK